MFGKKTRSWNEHLNPSAGIVSISHVFFLQTAQLVMVFLWPQALSAYYVTLAMKEEKEMILVGGGAEENCVCPVEFRSVRLQIFF